MHTILTRALVIGAFGLSATAALAQSQPTSPSSQGTSTQGSGSSATQSPAMRPPAAMTQDRLRQVLGQAGFQDVKVVDASYLVQARTKEGDSILMLINPPDLMRGASSASGSSASTSSPAATGSTGSASSAGGASSGTGTNKQ